MGQGQSQSQGQEAFQTRAPTPENERIDPEERARVQAERAARAAAAEQRLTSKRKTGAVAPSHSQGKKLSALEELSRENKGWRDADEQATLRAYN